MFDADTDTDDVLLIRSLYICLYFFNCFYCVWLFWVEGGGWWVNKFKFIFDFGTHFVIREFDISDANFGYDFI